MDVPKRLSGLHYIAASRSDCLEEIKSALDHQIKRLGLKHRDALAGQDLQWSIETFQETSEGSPGLLLRADFVNLTSDRYKNVDQIGHFIRGRLVEAMFQWRSSVHPLEQPHDSAKSLSSYDATAGKPSLVGRVVSVPYNIYWYGAGAAHPNQDFEVFNFILEPLLHIPSLESLFAEQEAALVRIQALVREQLLSRQMDDGTPLLDREHVERGTLQWADFAKHEYSAEGLRFLFPPYQVGAYAVGPSSAKIAYTELVPYMTAVRRRVLGLH